MSSYAETLLERFSSRGLLIDTNLLLLYVVGEFNQDIIQRGAFDRLSAYTLQDLQLLRGLMAMFQTFVTTAHVLAEVSNWLGYLPRQQEIVALRQFNKIFEPFEELHLPASQVSKHSRFPFLGLTDTAIAQVASHYLVLSDDARFIGHLNQMSIDALNINHLRQELWLRG